MAFCMGILLYIDAMSMPLEQFNGNFKVIAEGVVEKVDPEKKIAVVKVGRCLKGRSEYTHVRMNLGAGPGWHPEAVMPHLVRGAPVVLWYYWGAGPKAALYVNRFFVELYLNPNDGPQDPAKPWWHMNALATLYNRTYNGPVEEIVPLLEKLLAGQAKGPRVDPKRPPITRESLAALPPGGKPADPRTLPLPFRGRVAADPTRPREPDRTPALARGLRVDLFEGRWTALPDLDALKPAKSETRESPGPATRDREYALRFSGFLEVPRSGVYTLTIVSNDGARLRIGATDVVDNDHFKGVVESGGEIALKAGPHAFRLDYFQNDGFQVLEAHWEGPDLPRQPIPASAFGREAR